ncbi:MAG TPA: hypothetical protein VLE70_02220 [Anaerolineae bacterium]|nr:hypothetical protein [Anaerolineae bacterium]
MKKAIIGLLLTVGALVAATATASAAGKDERPGVERPKAAELFDGTFQGTIYGDKGSSAPIELQLAQRGRNVQGNVAIGSGLYVNGGMCGSGYIPGGAQSAGGRVSASNPNRLYAESTFKVSGLKVSIDLTGIASDDGEEVDAQAKIDLPWLCGRDPVLSGTLYRTQ